MVESPEQKVFRFILFYACVHLRLRSCAKILLMIFCLAHIDNQLVKGACRSVLLVHSYRTMLCTQISKSLRH